MQLVRFSRWSAGVALKFNLYGVVNMIRTTGGQDVVLSASSRKRRILWLCGSVLGLVSVVGLVALVVRWEAAVPSIAKSQVRVAKVERGDLVREVSAAGKVVAANAPTIYSASSGNVDLLVNPGTRVEKGQVVATIYSPELDSQLKQQQAQLETRRNQYEFEKLRARRVSLEHQQKLDLAKVSRVAAEREKRRADLSFNKRLISDIDYREVVDNLARAELLYEHAKKEVQLSQDTLAFELKTSELEVQREALVFQELQRKVKELSITSPVAGHVGNWLVEQKSQVENFEALMVVIDLSEYEAELAVSESYVDALSLGMSVNVKVNGQLIEGELISISPEVKNQQVMSRVRFTSSDNTNLRQNQRVSARIHLDKRSDVLMVRRGAFVNAGGKFGYLVNDGNATKTPLRLGGSSVSHIEIVSGVEAGDMLVISALDNFKQADRVLLR